jgi:hypothetical protein
MNSAVLLEPLLILKYFFSSIFQSLWRTDTTDRCSWNSTIPVLVINVIELHAWYHCIVLTVHVLIGMKVILIQGFLCRGHVALSLHLYSQVLLFI